MSKELFEIKNCVNCKHLEWIGAEEMSGYICNKRKYKSTLDEARHLAKLEYTDYMKAPKKCCDIIGDGMQRQVERR